MHNCNRKNADLAKVIDDAIEIDSAQGAANAWAYLMAHSVHPKTILRVLSSQHGRRSTPHSR